MDETEVSLELSIGGSYGKSVDKEKEKQRDPPRKFAPRSDFSCEFFDGDHKEKKRKLEDRGGDDQIQKGGSTTDKCREIYSRLNQCSSSRSSAPKRLRDDNSKSKTDVHSNSPTVVTPSVLLTKPQAQGGGAQQMPCVTTTGNGPQGKTVTGFLCNYTKTEVSIVCVCHRRLFSPLEFVKHAGGVDIVNPLRQITIVNPVKR